jgi:hypothetical protein
MVVIATPATLTLPAGVLLLMVTAAFNALSATVLLLFFINFMLRLITAHAVSGREHQS